MTGRELTQKEIAEVRLNYPPGTRIKLIRMDDNWAVPSGTRGTVKFVDDSGQLHPIWDNGRTLAIVPEVDIFRKLTELELQEEQEFKQQDQGEQRDFLEVQSL
mgnify:CR=1 FL=1